MVMNQARAPHFRDTLLIRELAPLLKMSAGTIRRALKAGTFPIPPLRMGSRKLCWSGPAVKHYLESNGRLTNGRGDLT